MIGQRGRARLAGTAAQGMRPVPLPAEVRGAGTIPTRRGRRVPARWLACQVPTDARLGHHRACGAPLTPET